MKAFWVKTDDGKFLGNEECVFVFMSREEAEHRLATTDAEPQEKMWISEIRIEEVQ